ncbi:STAS domain-containing protein [Peribacillus saganii]|nr:STAS domain-containing protein [Peribacillus saganii]
MDAVAEYLIKKAETVSREIVQYNIDKLEIELPEELIKKAIITHREFIKFLGETLYFSDEEVAADFVEWFKKYEEKEENYKVNISSIIKPYADTRQRLINIVTAISMEHRLTTEEVVRINNRISYLLDISMTETILLRERITEKMNIENQKLITEISSPIVPIQNGIAILPLIGEIDLDRTEHIMTNVIPKIGEMKIECLIIDFSGIVTIDTEIASRILGIYDVLRLLGIDAMFTGIRPDLAARVVIAGIDFSSLRTYATVQQAILSMA